MAPFTIRRLVAVDRTPRVAQLEGLFDLPLSQQSTLEWTGDLPLEERPWSIGLIVGASGSGKSTVARALFGETSFANYDWPAGSVIDGFPETMSLRSITHLLSSVGFSSPPAWLRPFRVLSTGEQFRANLARALAESEGTVVVDEFTSVVDRTVARIGSAAVARTIRRRTPGAFRFVAVSCHDDIVDWLDPDWIYVPASNAFQWRLERRPRPPVPVEIVRVHRAAWNLFKHHHYLSAALHRSARCLAGLVDGRPAAFTAVLPFPHPRRPGWREHRTVCLPDYQGIGIGNGLSEFVAALFAATGRPYRSTTSHPAMIRHRARSPLWRMVRPPSITGSGFRRLIHSKTRRPHAMRMTASFEFVGPPLDSEAITFGLVRASEAPRLVRKVSASPGRADRGRDGQPAVARPLGSAIMP